MKTTVILALTALLPFTGLGVEKKQPRSDQGTKPELVIGKIIPKKPAFPRHWGHPPKIQTRDLVKLPGKFGRGSSTLAHWIAENLREDAKKKEKPVKPVDGQKPKPVPPIQPIPRPEPSKEIKEKLAAIKLVQSDLSLARKDLRDQLKGKSKEDIADLVSKFRNSQKEKFQQLKVAQKALREEVRNRVQTGDRRDRE